MKENAKRVLIFRTGSLGDTVIALPSFHLIAKSFPTAERYLLTACPIGKKSVALWSILENTGLVHDYISYQGGLRNVFELLELWKKIRSWQPDVLVYLAEPYSFFSAWRNAMFFRLAGIKKMIGVPYTKDLRQCRWLSSKELFEHESVRLTRTLKILGDVQIKKAASWDLHLTLQEQERATECLSNWTEQKFIVCSPTSKVDVKDWGQENWHQLLHELTDVYPEYGLVFVGVREDIEKCARLGKVWKSSVLNLCGVLTPRESAAVLGQAKLFLGHDGGPMHLAVAMGVSCVAVFSAHSKPGVWFPYGESHKAIYHQTHCYGCKLSRCDKYQKKCITSITVDEVLDAVHQVMNKL